MLLMYRVLLLISVYALLGGDALETDTATVGSYVREVRALPPLQKQRRWQQHWDSGDAGESGYLKNEDEKGNDGYKNYDSYHKKDADQYNFEHHTTFGHGEKNGAGGHGHHRQQANYEHGGKQKHGRKKDKKIAAGTGHSYQVSEDTGDDIAPGSDDIFNFSFDAPGGGGDSGEGAAAETYNEYEEEDDDSKQDQEEDADDGESAAYYADDDGDENQNSEDYY